MILGLSSPTYMGCAVPSDNPLMWLLDRCAEYDLHALEANLPPDNTSTLSDVYQKANDLDVEWIAFWHGDFVEPMGGVERLREVAARAFDIAKRGGCHKLVIYGDASRYNRFISAPPVMEQLSKMVQNLGSVAEEAAQRGLKLGLLPHLDYQSLEILKVIEELNHPALGVGLDCANAIPVCEDPVEAVRNLSGHAIAVAFKDLRVYPYRSNQVTIWGTPIGQGSVDYEGILPLLKSRLLDAAETTACIKLRLQPGSLEHDSWLRQSIKFLTDRL